MQWLVEHLEQEGNGKKNSFPHFYGVFDPVRLDAMGEIAQFFGFLGGNAPLRLEWSGGSSRFRGSGFKVQRFKVQGSGF